MTRHLLALVGLQIGAHERENQILHRKAQQGGPPLSAGPGGHESVHQNGPHDPSRKAQRERHLTVSTPTGRIEVDANAAGFLLFAGHSTKGQLGHAHQPRKPTQVIHRGGEDQTDGGDATPQLHLRLNVLLVRFDHQTLGPARGVPLLGGLGSVVVVVSTVKRDRIDRVRFLSQTPTDGNYSISSSSNQGDNERPTYPSTS